jgi:3-hydroxyisobutyrate dehydrogenase-like beta-hydroxyacid dehydrogenase
MRGKARQVAVLDAPVSGGREGAEKLTLTTIVGGNRSVFDRCKPVFESFSRKVVLMGPAGSGQLAKLVNNTLLGANMKNIQLALAIAEPLKLDVAALVDMLRSSSGASFALEAFATQMSAELAPHYQEMIGKDIRHFIEAAELRGFKPEELTSAALAGVAGIVAAAETIRTASEAAQ